MRVVLGTQGWSYADWAGTMYDAAARPETYLRAYAEEFGSVEIDSTFYGTPPVERVLAWSAAVPDGFAFSCKLPREITHERRLLESRGLIAEFYESMRAFGPKLGCVLAQFDAGFSRAEESVLREALSAIPSDLRTAFEFRNPAWYRSDVQAMLEERGFALAVADAPFVPREPLREVLIRSTATFAYVRWIGTIGTFDRFDRVRLARPGDVAWWSRTLRDASPSIDRAFGYANNNYEGHSPATVRALAAALGIEHERPRRIEQTRLF